MDLQRRSTRIFPLELVDIIMAFAKGLLYIGDANEVFPKELECVPDGKFLWTYTRTYYERELEEKNKRPIPLLLNLSLVCREWLVLSRKHRLAGCNLNLYAHDSRAIKRFREVLSNGDRLSNLPNILSFTTKTVVLHCPYNHLSGNLSELLTKMSNRETYFRPRHLRLKMQEPLIPDVFPSLSSAFSTITTLWIDSHFSFNATQIIGLVTSLPQLESTDGCHHSLREGERLDMSQRRLPDSLHTMVFDFWKLPLFGPRVDRDSSLLPFTEWLQSHPPAPNMRHLELRWGSHIDVEFIQAFLDICPNLNTLTFGTKRDPLEKHSEDWVDYSVFDLSSVTTLRDLIFDIVPLLDYRNCAAWVLLETVGRILQTVKLSKAIITLRLDVYRYFKCYDVEFSAEWWETIDQAMSQLPQDVTLTILALHPWENDQEMETSIINDFRTMLSRTQEQSKLTVITEIAVFPDDDEYLADQ